MQNKQIQFNWNNISTDQLSYLYDDCDCRCAIKIPSALPNNQLVEYEGIWWEIKQRILSYANRFGTTNKTEVIVTKLEFYPYLLRKLYDS